MVSLQGLLAHHRGEWFQRLRGELRSVMRRPELAVGIFDSHLCVAEYLLYGPTPYDEVLELAGSYATPPSGPVSFERWPLPGAERRGCPAQQTLGSVLKYREDLEAVRDDTLGRLVEEARAAAPTSR